MRLCLLLAVATALSCGPERQKPALDPDMRGPFRFGWVTDEPLDLKDVAAMATRQARDEKGAVELAIIPLLPKLVECYTARLAEKPALAGRMVFLMRLDGQGLVSSAEVEFDTLLDDQLRECAVSAVVGARLPTRAKAIRYPFVFTSSSTPPEVRDALLRGNRIYVPEKLREDEGRKRGKVKQW